MFGLAELSEGDDRSNPFHSKVSTLYDMRDLRLSQRKNEDSGLEECPAVSISKWLAKYRGLLMPSS